MQTKKKTTEDIQKVSLMSGDNVNNTALTAKNTTTGSGAQSVAQKTKTSSDFMQAPSTVSGNTGYNSKYGAYIDKTLNNILNREPYSYDADNDETFQLYKERYTAAGKKAMEDTVGNAALLTGGYGNSYGVTAGQQAYNDYMDALSDKTIELENQAYQRWLQEGDEFLNRLNVLQQADSIDYGRYRDDVADTQWREQFEYGKSQDALAQENWQKSFDRQNYESDRAYDRDVYEYNTALQQAAAEKADEIDDDEYFNPNDAYEFFKEYGEYAGSDAEIAEVFVQLFGAQDGFKTWAAQITLPDGGNLLEEIYALYPQLTEQTAADSEMWEYINKTNDDKGAESDSSNKIQDIINYRGSIKRNKPITSK